MPLTGSEGVITGAGLLRVHDISAAKVHVTHTLYCDCADVRHGLTPAGVRQWNVEFSF
jgi:hypothetical protein